MDVMTLFTKAKTLQSYIIKDMQNVNKILQKFIFISITLTRQK